MLFFSRGRHFFNNPDMTHFLSLFWEGNDSHDWPKATTHKTQKGERSIVVEDVCAVAVLVILSYGTHQQIQNLSTNPAHL